MTNQEKLPLEIKAIRISQDLITELHNTLESQFIKISASALTSKTYSIYFEKDHEKQVEDLESFKDLALSDEKVSGFQLKFASESADVGIDAKPDDIKCHITSKNLDNDWALATKSKLSDVFNKYRTIRYRLPDSVILVLSFFLSCGLSYMITLSFSKFFDFDQPSFVTCLAITAIIVFFPFLYLILWLFPTVETEYMNRVKHRNQILSIIIAGMGLPAILEIIFSFLRQ